MYTFPPVEDPEDEKVELKIITKLDERYTTFRKTADGSTQLIFDKENIPFDKALNKSTGGKETFEETIWLTLEDSYGNVVYFFLRAIFIPPAVLSTGNNNFTIGNFTLPKDCNDEILKAKITDIDRDALVNVTYSQELYNGMFTNVRIEDKDNKIPRWLNQSDANSSSSTGGECYVWRKVPPGSMNLTDLNTT